MKISKFQNSERLFARALKTVPLASQTFSKSSINVVKGASPLFMQRGEGARVWDVDGNEYIDYVLGLLPVVLGYCDPDVDRAIRGQLEKGIIFSMATELEAELAERLVRLVPCAEMVRFGKNGSDATSAAIRLARAATGRSRVALCGYHGWHDWYIGSTARHLGVPDDVRALSSTFVYNDADSLEALLDKAPNDFAAIILEPAGVQEPAPGFLERIRELANHYGVVLVFDEIVTGFRLDIGGAQAKYGITPDLACFGKAMGNGMPISAIVGREGIMRLMEDIFFSGTFGGEALSLAAAIATIDKIEKTDAIRRIHKTGVRLAKIATDAFANHDLAMRYDVTGPDWRPVVTSTEVDEPRIIAASLLKQELTANGIMMGSGFGICLAHDDEDVLEETRQAWNKTAETLAQAFGSNDPQSFLRGEPIRPIFQVRPS